MLNREGKIIFQKNRPGNCFLQLTEGIGNNLSQL